MPSKKIPNQHFGLERLCTQTADRPALRTADRIEAAPSLHGVERVSAFFRGRPYAPHRHDTYGIGITTHGVQLFEYRGATEHSLAGQVYVLHPDEMHDGRAGTEEGFAYQTLYLDPGLVHQALDGRALPFVARPVRQEPDLRAAVAAFLDGIPQPIDALAGTDMVLALAHALERISEARSRPVSVDYAALAQARELLSAKACETVTSGDLEAATGHDRWSVARQFRAAFGVSPHRFQILRRLDRARALIGEGASLASAALQTGFADQAHFSRHFKGAYGVPPGIWRRLTTSSHDRRTDQFC